VDYRKLPAGGGRLPRATLQQLKRTFEGGIRVYPSVELEDGRPEISLPFKFLTAEAAIAFAFLRLPSVPM
jgi:hypothetical protein